VAAFCHARASLDPVKSLRILVLVLLALLLPLRGVSAAALPCGQQPTSHTELPASAHEHELSGAAALGHAQHEHEHGRVDKERHCQSSCSATPLISALPLLVSPALTGTTTFAHLAAPAATFQSDGQERPPRST